MPGITGQLYQQFAITIAASTFFSAVNALTLSPALCALILKPQARNFVVFRYFNRGFDWIAGRQNSLVRRLTSRRLLMMGVFVALTVITFLGFGRLPTGFLPEEDQGYVIVGIQLPDAASIERTKAVINKVDAILAETPGVAHRLVIGGISLLDNSASLANAAVMYAIFESFEERAKSHRTQEVILADLRRNLSQVMEAIVFPVVPPAIQGLGVSGGFQMQVQLKGGSTDLAKLQTTAAELVANGNAQSKLAGLTTSFRATVPQLFVDVDRIKAESLNVAVGDVFSTIQAYLGSSYVNQFNKFNRTFQVYVQADSRYRLEPEDIRDLYVRSRDGKAVPIGTMTKVAYVNGPSVLSLYNLYPSAAVNGRGAPGVSSGDALALMEEMAARTLPPDMGFEWTGMSFQEKRVGGQAALIFGLSVLIVFLVLAAQYESWTNPAAVVLVVPLALLGVVVATMARALDNNVYTQIGIVLLIALASKNAILIVEFARELRAKGKSVEEAAIEAAHLRFRPILMTSFAFILGVVPLVIASGAGAASRQILGTAVFGGMIAATLFNGLFVPVFYTVFQGLSERGAGARAKTMPAPPHANRPPAE